MIIDDVVVVLHSNGFVTEKVKTHPQFQAIIACIGSIRSYFIWRDFEGELTFQIARVWEEETSRSIGVFPNVTEAIRNAKIASDSTNLS